MARSEGTRTRTPYMSNVFPHFFLSHWYLLHAIKTGKTSSNGKYLCTLFSKQNDQRPILSSMSSSNALGDQIQVKHSTSLICLSPSFLLCPTTKFLANGEYRSKWIQKQRDISLPAFSQSRYRTFFKQTILSYIIQHQNKADVYNCKAKSYVKTSGQAIINIVFE